jgi:hypothetical protein
MSELKPRPVVKQICFTLEHDRKLKEIAQFRKQSQSQVVKNMVDAEYKLVEGQKYVQAEYKRIDEKRQEEPGYGRKIDVP